MKFKIVEEIQETLEYFGIHNYKFNSDATLDVFQTVNLAEKKLTELPFKFGKVDGDFYCYKNKLKSLQDCPKIIDGDFDCNNNKLKDLKYAPEIVNGDFYCYMNDLKSLDGLNIDGVSGIIYARDNPDLKFNDKVQLLISLNPGKIKITK